MSHKPMDKAVTGQNKVVGGVGEERRRSPPHG